MHILPTTLQPPKRQSIKFIRNVAAPKKSPLKSQSTTNIVYPHTSSSNIPPPYSLLLYLTFEDGAKHTLLFNYNEHVKVSELIDFIKSKIGMEFVYFKSGNLMVDYFLTLGARDIVELAVARLELMVYQVEVGGEIGLGAVEVLKCVGSGGFSKVVLARVYGIMMAIKIIDKQFIFKTAKQSIVQNQKQILQICSGHPFITKLFLTFETNKYIILGMQYCNGGQLFNLLRKVKKMKQQQAKFYFIQTLLAIQCLHSKGILYRDLKPQNIILDADGHVRLADFGLSKIINRSVTYSFCGSAQYMSPQMLLKKGHSYQVDLYCLGALLYELVTGLPPFYSSNQAQLFNSILNSSLTFPSHAILSDQLKTFLQKILQKQPQNRFQSVQQILRDPWVSQDFNRDHVLAKRVIPPYPTSIFNFNFDETQFGFQQDVLLKAIEVESRAPAIHKVFNDFYFEGEEIINIRNEIQKKRNFVKSRTTFLRDKGKIESRNTSIYMSPQAVQSSTNLQLRQQQSSTILKTSGDYQRPQHYISNKLNIKSSQNIRTVISSYSNSANHHSRQQKTLSPPNIYTTKPRFSPSSIMRRNKLSNQIYSTHSDKNIEAKISKPISRDQIVSNYWSKSQQKSNSMDRQYTMHRREQLSSQHIKSYLAQYNNYRHANPKVKKSYRNGEKINFYYGAYHR